MTRTFDLTHCGKNELEQEDPVPCKSSTRYWHGYEHELLANYFCVEARTVMKYFLTGGDPNQGNLPLFAVAPVGRNQNFCPYGAQICHLDSQGHSKTRNGNNTGNHPIFVISP